jgi:hypothetical protein
MRIDKRTKLLQVKIGEAWQWVFCNSVTLGPMTTSDYHKALPARHLDWFANEYGNHEFRVVTYVQA